MSVLMKKIMNNYGGEQNMADRNYDGTTIGQLAMWANNGDIIAMHKLATAYYEGIRVEENPQVALEYYMKAADGGNPDSILTLSNIYVNGKLKPA